MEYGADLLGEVTVDGECVLERFFTRLVTSVDDDIFPQLGSELEMLAQEIALAAVVGIEIPAIGGWVEVVETGLANGNATWVQSHFM